MTTAAVRRLPIDDEPAADLAAAARARRDLLVALGRDADSEHLAQTPRRVARGFGEMLTTQPFDAPSRQEFFALTRARN
jgi:GTP cyclohydrolase IA